MDVPIKPSTLPVRLPPHEQMPIEDACQLIVLVFHECQGGMPCAVCEPQRLVSMRAFSFAAASLQHRTTETLRNVEIVELG